MTQEKAADLFAYFVSARYFEKPGNAARGKAAFAAKHCAECHGIASSPVAAAPPVAETRIMADPVVHERSRCGITAARCARNSPRRSWRGRRSRRRN